MPCILRVEGRPGATLEHAVEHCPFPIDEAWRAGDRRAMSSRAMDRAGFQAWVSESDDAQPQFGEALAFLQENEAALAELRANPEVEHLWLDFGVMLDVTRFAALSMRLPRGLVETMGRLDVGCGIAVYLCNDAERDA